MEENKQTSNRPPALDVGRLAHALRERQVAEFFGPCSKRRPSPFRFAVVWLFPSEFADTSWILGCGLCASTVAGK